MPGVISSATITPPGVRDIVATGRSHTRLALLLLVAPQLLNLSHALSGNSVAAGGETARAIIVIGFLYLIYRGFRITRGVVLLFALVNAIYSGAMVVRSEPPGLELLFLITIGTIGPIAGIAILLFSPAARAFLTYQLGGNVAQDTVS